MGESCLEAGTVGHGRTLAGGRDYIMRERWLGAGTVDHVRTEPWGAGIMREPWLGAGTVDYGRTLAGSRDCRS